MASSAHEVPIDLQLDVVREICQRYGVAHLALFGSVLRDDFTDHSDIDVLCRLQPDSPVTTLLDWIHLKQALEDVWLRPVDLVEPHLLHPMLRDAILAEERGIYGATPYAQR